MLNPVFRRELRTALRSWKTYGAITIYVLVLAAVAAISLYTMINNSYYYGYSTGFDPQETTTLYGLLSGFQFGLMLIITPALTSGSIAGERERQTLNLMLITKMSTFKIALGKLMSSLTVTALMIIASMPVFAIVFYYGGISITGLVAMVLYTLLSAATIGSISIFFSAVFKRTVSSTVVSYIVIMIMTIGTFVAALMLYAFINMYRYSYMPSSIGIMPSYSTVSSLLNMDITVIAFVALMSFNPFVGFLSVLDTQLGTGIVNDLIYEFSYSYYGGNDIKLWIYNIAVNIVLVVLMLFLTSKVLRPVKESRKNK